MIHSIQTVTKLWVRSFYLENASFFLFVVAIAGGFMSKIEHIALADFFLSSPITLFIPVFLWALYAVRVIAYNQRLLYLGENEFALNLILFPRIWQAVMLACIAATQFLPAVFYGGFLMTRIQHDGLIAISITLFSLILIMTGIAVSLRFALHHVNRERKTGMISRFINRHFIRPYPWYVVEWISRRHTGMLIGVKFAGSVLLFGVLQLYVADQYDSRLLNMSLVAVSAVSAPLIFEIHRFNNFHFLIIRQMPFSLGRRILYLVSSVASILLLELGLLITYFPSNLSFIELLEAVLFLHSCFLLLYVQCYRGNADQEKQMRFISLYALAGILLVLFGVPEFFLLICNLVIAAWWWQRFYYRFEFVE